MHQHICKRVKEIRISFHFIWPLFTPGAKQRLFSVSQKIYAQRSHSCGLSIVILRKYNFKVSYVSELPAGMAISVRVYVEIGNGHGYQIL